MNLKKSDWISFYDFFKIFLKLQRIQLTVRPFHKEVCDTLQAAFLGQLDKRFIIINISPRVGKTKLIEAFTCWCYAYFPDCHFINASYSDDLATSTTRYVRECLQSDWFLKIFGNVMGDLKQADHFKTISGGVMKGSGLSGTLTGFGCGLKRPYGGCLLIDDIQKPNEALSKASTEAVHRWLTGVINSRMNSPHTPVIVCAQRISEEDICGYIMKNFPDNYVLLKYPALVNGESTIQDTISTKDLKDLERIDPFTFFSQYQQEPIVLGGNLIKTDWFRYYDDENLKFDRTFFTADTAMKTKEHNDFSVICHWGIIGQKLYLIDMVRGKWEAHVLEKIFIEFFQKHHPNLVYIEDKASGTGLIQTLRNKGFPIVDVQRTKDKLTRVMEACPFLAIGVLYLKKDLPMMTDFLSECAGFRADMGHKHDDIVDCVTDAVMITFGGESSVLDCL